MNFQRSVFTVAALFILSSCSKLMYQDGTLNTDFSITGIRDSSGNQKASNVMDSSATGIYLSSNTVNYPFTAVFKDASGAVICQSSGQVGSDASISFPCTLSDAVKSSLYVTVGGKVAVNTGFPVVVDKVGIMNFRFQAALDQVVAGQNPDGGFRWTSGTASAWNLASTPGMALILGYKEFGTPAYLAAAKKAADYILTKPLLFSNHTQHFSVTDIKFLYLYSKITGDTTYSNWADASYWNLLMAGTYGASANQTFAAFTAATEAGYASTPLATGQFLDGISPVLAMKSSASSMTAAVNAVNTSTASFTSDYWGSMFELSMGLNSAYASNLSLSASGGLLAGAASNDDLLNLILSRQIASPWTNVGAIAGDFTNGPCDPTIYDCGDQQASSSMMLTLTLAGRDKHHDQSAKLVSFLLTLQMDDGSITDDPGDPALIPYLQSEVVYYLLQAAYPELQVQNILSH